MKCSPKSRGFNVVTCELNVQMACCGGGRWLMLLEFDTEEQFVCRCAAHLSSLEDFFLHLRVHCFERCLFVWCGPQTTSTPRRHATVHLPVPQAGSVLCIPFYVASGRIRNADRSTLFAWECASVHSV
eukprot:12434-Heterococcus_DN1.PRE.8